MLTLCVLLEQFLRATKAALRSGKSEQVVTPLQIDILFALFDLDGATLACSRLADVLHRSWSSNVGNVVVTCAGDGFLSPKEFIHVMEKRKDGGFNEVRPCVRQATVGSRRAASVFSLN